MNAIPSDLLHLFMASRNDNWSLNLRLLALLSLIKLSATNKSLIPYRYAAAQVLKLALFMLCKSKYDALEVETGRLRAAPEVTQHRLEETISQLEELKMRSELKIPLLELKIQELTDSERDARRSAQSAKAALEGLRVSFGLFQLYSYLTFFTGAESKRQGFFLLSHSRIGKGKCCLLHKWKWKLGFPGKLANFTMSSSLHLSRAASKL